MCGLVGVAGKIGKKENEVFRDLLMIDVIRGPHSTGIATLPRHSEGKVFKKALLPQELFQMHGCGDMFSDYGMHKMLLGHNRWATVGKVNSINAHPFELDNLIGAHNGTLRQQHLLPDHQQFQTDSENIFHSFEKLGVPETVKKLNGAYALTWFDKNQSVLNILRNEDRTLYYTFINEDKTFVWASEAWMIEGVLARNGLKHSGILTFEPMHHYTLEIPEKEDGVFEKFEKLKVEGYVPPKSQTTPWKGHQSGKSNSHGRNTSARSTGTTTSGGETSDGKKQYESSSDRGAVCEMSYTQGDYVAFRGIAQSISSKARYVYGRDIFNSSTKLKIYLPVGSVTRKKMLEDPTGWWAGIINGQDKSGAYIIQGNSVKDYDDLSDHEFNQLQEDNSDRERDLRAAQLAALHEDEDSDDHLSVQEDGFDEGHGKDSWEQHVTFIAGVGQCGWCNETLDPTEDNLIVNSQAVFCPSCRKNPDLKQFFPEE